jgi:hypothetical protein
MRTRFFGTVVAVLGLSAFTPGQTVPPAQPSQPSNIQDIRIRGCLNGRSIRPAQDANPLSLQWESTYRLKGSRAIMDTLKEHDGHEDEIVGTTKISTSDKAKAVKEKKVGRGRVYVGAGSDKTAGGPPSSEDFTIDVTALTHLKSGC